LRAYNVVAALLIADKIKKGNIMDKERIKTIWDLIEAIDNYPNDEVLIKTNTNKIISLLKEDTAIQQEPRVILPSGFIEDFVTQRFHLDKGERVECSNMKLIEILNDFVGAVQARSI